MSKKLQVDSFYCLLAAIITFFIIPIYMVGLNPVGFDFIDPETFLKTGAFLSITLFFIFFSVCLVLHFLNKDIYSRKFAYFCFLWVSLAGFLFPIVQKSGMVDPIESKTHFLNFGICFILSVGLSLFATKEIKKYVSIFIFVVITTSFGPSLITVYDTDFAENNVVKQELDPSFILSKKKNILVLSFDGMDGEITSEVLKTEGELYPAFKDFILFDNATSQSPATDASVMGEIYGIHDFKAKGESLEDVVATLVEDGVSEELFQNKAPDTYRYRYYSSLPNVKAIPLGVSEEGKLIQTVDFFLYPITRIWARYPIKALGLQKQFFSLAKLLFGPIENSEYIEKVQNGYGPLWDRKLVYEINLYDQFVDQLAVGEKDFSARFLHFGFTHFPVDFDENCIFRGDDEGWFNSHQNEEGIKGQSKCVLNQANNFIEKLKKLDIYKNSLIVLKSDHGKPANSYNNYPGDITLNDHELWGYKRYRPFLMIKDFESNQEHLRVRSDLVLLNDLAQTLCLKAEYGTDCTKLPGENLFSEEISSDKPFYLYVAKDPSSGFEFSAHKSVKILNRNLSLIDAMEKSDQIAVKSKSNINSSSN